MMGPCFSVMLKCFGPNWSDDRQIAVPRKPCDSGPGMANPLVPTVISFGPMGVIHPSDGFHYGFVRRVNSFTIALPQDPRILPPFLDGKHQKSLLKRPFS